MVVEKTTDDWWLACNETGKIGYVPGSYLQERLGRYVNDNADWSKTQFQDRDSKILILETLRWLTPSAIQD